MFGEIDTGLTCVEMVLGISSITSFGLFLSYFVGFTITFFILFVSLLLTHTISHALYVHMLAKNEGRLPSGKELGATSAVRQSSGDVLVGFSGLAAWIASASGVIVDELGAVFENAGLLVAALALALTGIFFYYYDAQFYTMIHFLYNDVLGPSLRGFALPVLNSGVLAYSAAAPVWNTGMATFSTATTSNAFAVAICSKAAFAPIARETSVGLAETTRALVEFVDTSTLYEGELNATDGLHAFGRAVGELKAVVDCACPRLGAIANTTLDIFTERSTAVALNSAVNFGVSLIQVLPEAVIYERRPSVERPAAHAVSGLTGLANVTDSLVLSAFYQLGRVSRGMDVNDTREAIPLALAWSRLYTGAIAGLNISLNAFAAADEIFDDPANEEALLDFAPVFTEWRLGVDALADVVALADTNLADTGRYTGRVVLGFYYALQRTAVGLAFDREIESEAQGLPNFLQERAWPGWVDPVWADADRAALSFGRFIASGTPSLTGRDTTCASFVTAPVPTGDLEQAFSGALVSSSLRFAIASLRLGTQATFFVDKLIAPGAFDVTPHVCSVEWQGGKTNVLNEMRAFVQSVSCSLSQFGDFDNPVFIADCGLPPPPPSPSLGPNQEYIPTCGPGNPAVNRSLGKIVDVLECSGQAVEDWGLAFVDVFDDAWVYAESLILVAEQKPPSGFPDCIASGYKDEPKFDITNAIDLIGEGSEQVGCMAAALVPVIGVADAGTQRFRERLPCLARASFNFVFVFPAKVYNKFATGELDELTGVAPSPGKAFVNGVGFLLREFRDATREFLYALGITLNSYEIDGVGTGEIFINLSEILAQAFTDEVIEEFVELNQDAIRVVVAFVRIGPANGNNVILFASALGDFLEDLGKILVSVGFRILVDLIDSLLPGLGHPIATFITVVANQICTTLQSVINGIIKVVNSVAKGAHWLSFGSSPTLDLSLNLNCPAFSSLPDTSYTGNGQMNIHGPSYCPELVLPSLANVTDGNSYGLPGMIGYAAQLSKQAEGCDCIEPFFSNQGDSSVVDYFDFLAVMYPFYYPNIQQRRSGGFGDCRPGKPQSDNPGPAPPGFYRAVLDPVVGCGVGADCVSGVCRQICTTNDECVAWEGEFTYTTDGIKTQLARGVFANSPTCVNGYCALVFDPESLPANYARVESQLSTTGAAMFVNNLNNAIFQQNICGAVQGLPPSLSRNGCAPLGGGTIFFEALRLFAAGGLNDQWIADTRNLGGTAVMEKFTRCENFVPDNDPAFTDQGRFCRVPIVGPTSITLDGTGLVDVCQSAAAVAAFCFKDSTPNTALPALAPVLTDFFVEQAGAGTAPNPVPMTCGFAIREEVVSQAAFREQYEAAWVAEGLPFNDYQALFDKYQPGTTDVESLRPFSEAVERFAPFLECACSYSAPGVDEIFDTYSGRVSAGFQCEDATPAGFFVQPCADSLQVLSWRDRVFLNSGELPLKLFCDSNIPSASTTGQSSFNDYMFSGFPNYLVTGNLGPAIAFVSSFSPSPSPDLVGAREEHRLPFEAEGSEETEVQRKIRNSFSSGMVSPRRLYDHRRNSPPPPPKSLDGLTVGNLPQFLYDMLRDPNVYEKTDVYTIGTAFCEADTHDLDPVCRARYDAIRSSVEKGAARIGVDLDTLPVYAGGKYDLSSVFGRVASPLVIIDTMSCLPGMPNETLSVLHDLTFDQWTGDSTCDRLIRELAFDEWHGRWPVPSERMAVMDCIKSRGAASVFRTMMLADELSLEFPLELFYSWEANGHLAFDVVRGAVALFMDDTNTTHWSADHIGEVLASIGIDDNFARALLDFTFEPGRAELMVNRTLQHLQTVMYSHHFFDEDHNPKQPLGFFARYFELFERLLGVVADHNLGATAHALPYGVYRASIDATRMGFVSVSRTTGVVANALSPLNQSARNITEGIKDVVTARVKQGVKGAGWAATKARDMLTGSPFHELVDTPSCREAVNGLDASVYAGINCPVIDKPIQVLIEYSAESYHWWSCALPLITDNYENIYYPYYASVAESGGENTTVTNTPGEIIDVAQRCQRPAHKVPDIPSKQDPDQMLRVIRVGPGVHQLFAFNTHNSSNTFGTARNTTAPPPSQSIVEERQNAQGDPRFDVRSKSFSAYDYLLSLAKQLGIRLGKIIDDIADFFLDERPFDTTSTNIQPQGGFRWYVQQALTCEPQSVFGQAPYRCSLGRGLVITLSLLGVLLLFGLYYSVSTYVALIATALFYPILIYVTYGMGIPCVTSMIVPVPLANDAFDLVASLAPACIPWPSAMVRNLPATELPMCLNPLDSPEFFNQCQKTGIVDFVWAFFLLLRWQATSVFNWFATSSFPVARLLRSASYFNNIVTTLNSVPVDPLPADYQACLFSQAVAATAFPIAFALALRALAPLRNLIISGGIFIFTSLVNFTQFGLYAYHDIEESYVEYDSPPPTREDIQAAHAAEADRAGLEGAERDTEITNLADLAQPTYARRSGTWGDPFIDDRPLLSLFSLRYPKPHQS